MRGDSNAYQTVPRAIGVMPKTYEAGATTGWHSHPRAQLLYATAGLTLVTAEDGTWILPAQHALWIPPQLFHEVRMHGRVSMCSAYVAPEAVGVLPQGCRVLQVTPLLASSLAALAAEPLLYDENGRGGHLAALILDEIARAPETPLTLPLPRDPRLRRVCDALLKDPASPLDLDGWAQHAGASRRTLTRGFRTETGMSFGEWRVRLRVVRALALATDGCPPHLIVRAVGYADLRTLRAAAERILGSAVLSWR
ncbi:helix-turn-helix transcriptional regulator [Bosea sp. F3-2]|uniref:AraC family transcriptional regulator n=1 Tax=Bosea sp. F3-2 TaxID=2599640 RepID=UPI0011EBC217|nr:helix-turn-helix transcriptional regulator [Bosea sp. F3-2]QEL24982.1 helix-turn-helix transcriptional regulator [Bosea sp. F3-2]